jgi:AcrR family transcriptional regulator
MTAEPAAEPAAVDPRIERTKAAVLEAVKALLAEEGWDAVSHQRVAERAGVHRATVWRHWPEPTLLIHDALEDESVPNDVVLSGDIETDLVALLESLRHNLVEMQRARMIAALIDRSAWQPELQVLKAELVRNGFPLFREALTAAVEGGRLRPVDEDHAVAQLVGPLFYRVLVSGEPVDASTIAAIAADFLGAYRR